MQTRLAAAARALARHPIPPLAVALALAVGFGYHAAHLGVDPGNEALYLEDDPAREGQAILDRELGGDELIAVALEGPVLGAEGLRRLEALHRAVEDGLWELGFEVAGERKDGAPTAGGAQVVSLVNAKNLYPSRAALAGVYAWAPYEWLVDGVRTDADGAFHPYGPADFAAEVTAEPLFAGNLVAADGGMAACIVSFERPPGGAAGGVHERAVEALRAAARAATGAGFEAHVAGFPVERYDFARLIQRDQRIFVPLIVVMIAVVTAALFRQLWGVVVPLVATLLAVAATSGLAALLGIAVNAVTSLLQPVVMVVAVAASVNLAVAYTQARARGVAAGPDAVGEAFRQVGPACLFTTLTTMLGFGALALSSVPAIRDFGALSAFGVAASYLAAWLLLPALFGLPWDRGPRGLRAVESRLDGLLGGLGPWIARRRGVVLAVGALVLAGAGAGIARLRVETDILGQLPPASDLARATRAIERRLGGVNALELLFEGDPGAFRRPAPLAALARVQAWADGARARERGVVKTLSVVDILARFREVRGGPRALPESAEELDYAFGLLDQAGADAPTRRLVSADGSIARLTVRLRSLPASQVYALLQDLAAEARAAAPEGVRVRPAGGFVLIQNMTHHLPQSQLRGVVAATACIVLAIALLFGSLTLGGLAALPASAPVLAAYGLMGWAGIDLSTATSMIASVVIGLAVDAAILLLARFRDERRAGLAARAALERTLGTAGASVTFSNLTLVGGFSVGALSSFPPVRDFAVLTAATIACTYLAALFILPALVLVFERDREPATTTAPTAEDPPCPPPTAPPSTRPPSTRSPS